MSNINSDSAKALINQDDFVGVRHHAAFLYAMDKAAKLQEYFDDPEYIVIAGGMIRSEECRVISAGCDTRINIGCTVIAGWEWTEKNKIWCTKKDVDEAFSRYAIYKPGEAIRL